MKLLKLLLPAIAVTSIALPIASCNEEKKEVTDEIQYLTKDQVESHFDQLKNINKKEAIAISKSEVPELLEKARKAFGQEKTTINNINLNNVISFISELSKIENVLPKNESSEEVEQFNFAKVQQSDDKELVSDKNLIIKSAIVKSISEDEIEISDIKFEYKISEDETEIKILNIHFKLS
jgi:hypothetical protein